VEKPGRARQATDDIIIRRMRIACWITNATNTLEICNTYCFTSARVVIVNITFILSLPVLSLLRVSVPIFHFLGHVFHFPLCKGVAPIVTLSQNYFHVQAIFFTQYGETGCMPLGLCSSELHFQGSSTYI